MSDSAQVVNKKPRIAPEPDGRVWATLRSEWEPTYAALMEREGVRGLNVADHMGFEGENLGFLSELPWLEALSVWGVYSVTDVSAVGSLTKLERLMMDASAKTPIDFSQLAHLSECRMTWIDGSDALFETDSLETLHLSHFHDPDLQRVGRLINLQDLAIVDSVKLRSTKGVGRLKSLSKLQLALLSNLREWDEIAELRELEVLDIETCRFVEHLDFVRSCRKLVALTFANCTEVDSSGPLKDLPDLERVYFWESTKIRDGDLSVLLRLPKLREARFANRRHYSHTREAISAEISRRG